MNNPEWAVRFANLGHAYDLSSWVFSNYSAEFPQGQVIAILDRMDAENPPFFGYCWAWSSRKPARWRLAVLSLTFRSCFG